MADATTRQADARRFQQLQTICQASLRLASELELERLLEKAIIACADLVAARYGALAVFDDDNVIETFIVTGITSQQKRAIGDLPKGHGLLGLMTRHDKPVLVSDISQHPESVGFPPNHPPMTSFLGLPVRSQGELLGVVYLTDKQGAAAFDDEDSLWLQTLASQIAVAIENARFYARLRELVAAEERDRIGRDLHDGPLQAIYGAGLRVQDALEALALNEPGVEDDLNAVVEELNQVTRDLRAMIVQLRPGARTTDVRSRIEDLAREMGSLFLMKVSFQCEGEVAALPRSLVDDLVFVVREALTNAYRHGQATSAAVRLRCTPRLATLEIDDEGRGLIPVSTPARDTGYGVPNMRHRIERHGGSFELAPKPPRGVRVSVTIPLDGGSDV